MDGKATAGGTKRSGLSVRGKAANAETVEMDGQHCQMGRIDLCPLHRKTNQQRQNFPERPVWANGRNL